MAKVLSVWVRSGWVWDCEVPECWVGESEWLKCSVSKLELAEFEIAKYLSGKWQSSWVVSGQFPHFLPKVTSTALLLLFWYISQFSRLSALLFLISLSSLLLSDRFSDSLLFWTLFSIILSFLSLFFSLLSLYPEYISQNYLRISQLKTLVFLRCSFLISLSSLLSSERFSDFLFFWTAFPIIFFSHLFSSHFYSSILNMSLKIA